MDVLESESHSVVSDSSWHQWELDHKEVWVLKSWCFWTVVLEKTLESSLDCKEIKPVNPKGYQPWQLLEELMLKLKLQYFGHLRWRANSLEKTLKLGKIEGKRRSGQQRMSGWMASPAQRTWVWVNSGKHWRSGKPGVLQFMGLQSRTRLSDWTTTTYKPLTSKYFQRNKQCAIIFG